MKYNRVCFIVLLLTVLFCFAKTVYSIPTDGLVFHVTFDNCAVVDETGHVSNFEIHGSPQCVPGVKGDAFYFDGDDWIGADTFFPGVQGTIIVFAKIDRLPMQGELWTILDSKTNFRSVFSIEYPLSEDSPIIRIGYSNANLDTNLLNRWLMLSIVYRNGNTDGGERIAYLNDQVIGQQTGRINEYAIPWYADSNTFNLNIGVNDWFGHFLQNVAVDEIMFYDRPLSQREIQSIYQEIVSSNDSSMNNSEEDIYTQGFEAGKEWCRQHPQECGINLTCNCPSSNNNDCAATFDILTNTLRIPNFQDEYWLEFSIIRWDPVQLELKRYGPLRTFEKP